MSRAHPRIRGEYPVEVCAALKRLGSPPHSRGILALADVDVHLFGLTPAFAGNTDREAQSMSDNLGSPPHSRGIPHHQRRTTRRRRLTPAFAGNTEVIPITLDIPRAHPRIRGEYQQIRDQVEKNDGSPPHSRGIPTGLRIGHGVSGLTPAFAGNTLLSGVARGGWRAHPRIRGEYPK